ncbi:class I SAM-dependent methyltransferase [Actinoplanes flavus]|uniref:Methyltransferase domain-containing protein n=1 Tax=Actinoplanes flavus TaxID=2820290 RepID=A0ABS3UIF4_9ACTN|nr:class I SAM-dependent methyltransferase [Actinoplanes flavus]MBO3738550.1 methyltransferase domain-containing protein [Actinoplanes flavus]
MPDAIFADPRLAVLYDTFDGDRGDLDAYQEIVAELGAHRILDVGCGTGCLALRLAAAGHTVTGVDPAHASLDVARGKPGADRVTWLPALPDQRFDLAVMTGNVAQVFVTDDGWHTLLSDLYDRLDPGGHLVFETRRPEYRVWDEWARDTAPVVRQVPGVGAVHRRRRLTEVRLPLVSFRYTYTFPNGDVLSSDSTLRFRDRTELGDALTAAGFEIADVRQAPDRPARERVFLCRRPVHSLSPR